MSNKTETKTQSKPSGTSTPRSTKPKSVVTKQKDGTQKPRKVGRQKLPTKDRLVLAGGFVPVDTSNALKRIAKDSKMTKSEALRLALSSSTLIKRVVKEAEAKRASKTQATPGGGEASEPESGGGDDDKPAQGGLRGIALGIVAYISMLIDLVRDVRATGRTIKAMQDAQRSVDRMRGMQLVLGATQNVNAVDIVGGELVQVTERYRPDRRKRGPRKVPVLAQTDGVGSDSFTVETLSPDSEIADAPNSLELVQCDGCDNGCPPLLITHDNELVMDLCPDCQRKSNALTEFKQDPGPPRLVMYDEVSAVPAGGLVPAYPPHGPDPFEQVPAEDEGVKEHV